jgi:murein DD-endopeptidase MepM/ murein hydrolase activator NlpD
LLRFRAVLALIAAIAAASQIALHPAPPLHGPTHFVWPATGTITTPYVPGGHPGVDIGILRSLTIRAAAAGRVQLVGERRGYEGYGNIVLVRVGGRYTTLYAHLSSYRVHMGQEIRAGEKLGIAGCTGWCTGTHLHFELRLHGQPVNPARFPFSATSGAQSTTLRP